MSNYEPLYGGETVKYWVKKTIKALTYEQVIRKLFTEEGKYCSRIVLFKFC